MSTFLVVVGLLVAVLGFLGCILPVIPGVPLSFAALLILSLARDWQAFSAAFLVGMAALTIFVSALDILVPAWGASRFGASRVGVWSSVIGMLAGLILLPPFGVFVGAFVGAVAGEMIIGKKPESALRAGWGVFVGTAICLGLKLAAAGFMLYSYIRVMV